MYDLTWITLDRYRKGTGQAVRVSWLLYFLKKLGNNICLICFDDPGDLFEDKAIPFRQISRLKAYRLISPLVFIMALFKNYQMLKKTIGHSRWIMTDAFFLPFILKILFKTKNIIVESHGSYLEELLNRVKIYPNPSMLCRLKKVEYSFYKHASVVVSNTKMNREKILQTSTGNGKIIVIENGAVTAGHRIKDVEFDFPRIVFLGSIRKWHGLPFILEVLKKLSVKMRVEFHLIGDGPEFSKIKEYAERIGVTHLCNFYGYVNPDRIQEYLKRGNIALYFPDSTVGKSRSYLGNPMKFYEYMTFGIPLVTLRDDEFRSSFDIIKIGFEMSADEDVVSDSIHQLFTRHLDLLKAKSIAAKRSALQNSWLIRSKKLARILNHDFQTH